MVSFFLFFFYFSYPSVRVEEYVNQEFNGSDVKVEVIKGQSVFEDMYPCLAAVNRCASVVPRHDGRVIWLTYEPEGRKSFSYKQNHENLVKSQSGYTEKLFSGPVEKTVMLVGKGITYDTGGADIKAGGIMAGMYTFK